MHQKQLKNEKNHSKPEENRVKKISLPPQKLELIPSTIQKINEKLELNP